MGKYLYGASIQGIQGFIFETNKLKEIVGASDIIEWFCSRSFLDEFSKNNNINISNDAVLRSAGGNIRIIFENREHLEKMVKYFPQFIIENAYGITLSQAVVIFEDGEYLNKKDELEYKLTKARNQASIPLDARFSLMKQTPRTGKPMYKFITIKEDIIYFDKGSWQKYSDEEKARQEMLLRKIKIEEKNFCKYPIKMELIANKNNKIAVIHADGNKIGLMLQQINSKLKENKTDEEIQNVFKEFSTHITDATNRAVEEAFKKNFDRDKSVIPLRPIVIGGDDVTILCNPDYALQFTRDYLSAFEKNTKDNFSSLVSEYNLTEFKNGLTACAGIVFCTSKFPFHYAVDLAEEICSYGKEKSGRDASCLLFHNIQSSYASNYKSHVENELTTKEGIFLQFSPYYTKDKSPIIDSLLEVYEYFSDSDIPLGKYREWLTELNKSQEYAELFLDRTDAILKSKLGKLKYDRLESSLKAMDSDLRLNKMIITKKVPVVDSNLESNKFLIINKTPMADILQLKSVLGGKK